MASEIEVGQIIIKPMRALYSPRRGLDNPDEAILEYVRHLTRFDAETLRAGWDRLTRTYKLGSWPSIGELIAVCEACEGQQRAVGHYQAGVVAEATYQRSMRAHAAIRSMAERAAEWHGAEVDAIAARTGVSPGIIAFHLRNVITRQAWEPVSSAIMDGRPHITDWTPSAEDWADVEGRAVSQARIRAKRAPGAKTLAEAAE